MPFGRFFLGNMVLTTPNKKLLMDNPPLNEDAVRLMMGSMGRKPSEVQVQQVLRQIRAAAKQSDTNKK